MKTEMNDLHSENRDGVAVFHEAAPPAVEELEVLLAKITKRVMRMLTRLGAVIEEPDQTYLAETDTDGAFKTLQAASCIYRIALGPRTGQKVLSLQSQARPSTPELQVNSHGTPISARNSSSSAATSAGPPSPTNGSNVTAPARSGCN